MPKKKHIIIVIQAVHLHPRYEAVIKLPMTGPAMGPTNVAAAKTHVATPLSTGCQKSAKVPPTIARGAEPKTPPKNRQSMMVYRFWATATPIWKIPNTKKPKNRGVFRPKTSDAGPHTYINGQSTSSSLKAVLEGGRCLQ